MNPKRLILPRRGFLKACAAAVAGAAVPAGIMIGSRNEAAAEGASLKPPDLAKNVHPEIGTGWHGHMFPGAVAPFGLVQLSPDSSGLPGPPWNGQGTYEQWDHCSGYHHRDNVIIGFSHTHVQGTGGIDLGDILLMPLVEGRNWSWDPGIPDVEAELQSEALGPDSGWVFGGRDTGYRSFFSHEGETARAGYYGVQLLTPDVRAELTATERCGMHRYTYPSLPAEMRQGIILDLVHGLGNQVYQAELKIDSATRISGMRATHGWSSDRLIYFVLEFSQPFTSAETEVDTMSRPAAPGDERTGKLIKAIFTHAPSTEPLVVRVGISATSVDGASNNLAAELPHWDFDAVARATEMEWNKALAVVDAELADEALTGIFYTGAYHGQVAPVTFNDVDGTYRGQDHQNHPAPGFTKYTTLSIWDIYRGQFPFLMLVQPHRTADIVRTLLADYEQLGLECLPMWPLWGNETWSMTGFHAAGMILGAYVRGLRDFDAEAAYTAIRNTALAARDIPPPGTSARDAQRWRDNGKLQEIFREHGWVPMDLHGGSVSVTLDLAYDYWCAGAMAELLGKTDDSALFYKLGQNYKNVFDPSTGFMRGKTADGKWRQPFRPDQEFLDYVETDAWQASTSVPHDVAGLIALHGGDEAFVAKMDSLFTAPSYVVNSRPDVTGMVGQDAQGNEPSNHTPYLYPFAGAAWKTQQWVRRVAALYHNTPAGIPGNDDCGQLSSWWVFAAVGFYPVNAANGVYVIGSPIINRVTIRNPDSGREFTIVAEDNSSRNVYIQRAELNGRELTRSWITHQQIVAGGELRFRMGPDPNKEWAQAPQDRPPSALVKN
jgi:predicted alpha-1,2-mannosidase